jgi:serine/tyrosine/threonine adenylyltransferase
VPLSPHYQPDPRFVALGPELADQVRSADFPRTILRWRNNRAAESVGLGALSDQEWIDHFARFSPLPDNQAQPLAMRYHGHQFRAYNPDLGDGRGFLFAQLREVGTDRLLDLGTKGSGQTPYSRFGDGRLTLKGAVRELLATEMLEALGVPTSRTFSIVETGEALERNDEPSPTRSAVLTRLLWSHIRFGTFQRHAFHDRADLLSALVDHVAELYYPDLAPLEGEAKAAALLGAVAERSARLCARWMSAGFVHGVLNTDNLNVTGESFDYGPWRFLPKLDPGFTAAYFDQTGLYAYGRQPEAVFWALSQFGGALTLLAGQDPLVEALHRFGPAYEGELAAAVVDRLGLAPRGIEADAALANAAFGLLSEAGERLRFEPLFFDWFGGDGARARAGPRAALYSSEAGRAFADLIAGHAPRAGADLTRPYFLAPDPQEMLIEEVEAIWSAIADADDWSPLYRKVEAVRAAGEAYGSGALRNAGLQTPA